jgi:hypothetical protein
MILSPAACHAKLKRKENAAPIQALILLTERMTPTRLFIVTALSVLPGLRTRGAEEPIVRLPQVVVAESIRSEAEHWRYVREGDFEIISQTKDDTINQLAQTLELIPVIVKTIWPAPNLIGQRPTEMVLCDSDKTFEGFIPQEVKKSVNAIWVDRLFLKDDQREVIVLKCDALDDEKRFRDILRDYARRCLLALKQPPPDWFVTGMAEVISDADYHVAGGKLKLQYAQLGKVTLRGGQAIEPSLYETEKPTQAVRDIIRGALDNQTASEAMSDEDTPGNFRYSHERFNAYFAKHRYHPKLEDVLRHSAALDPDDYRMTCWAFVHLCAFAQKRGYSRSLRVFLQLAGGNPEGDMIAMFRKAYGLSPQSMDITVSEYSTAAMTRGITQEIELKAPPPLIISDATPPQIGRLKSDAYRLGGHDSEAAAEMAKATQWSRTHPADAR